LSSASAGYETHPEETPYDNQVASLYKEIQKKIQKDRSIAESCKKMNSDINFLSNKVLQHSNDISDIDASDSDDCSTSSSASDNNEQKHPEKLVSKRQSSSLEDSGSSRAAKSRRNFNTKKGGNSMSESGYSERQEAKDRVALRQQQLVNDGLKLQAEIAASQAAIKATEERMMLYQNR
jgi:hypothetical protein